MAALGARLFAQAYGPTHPEPELSRYLARFFSVQGITKALGDEDVAIFAAEDGHGTAIGYAWLHKSRPPFPEGVTGEHPWEIYHFYVDAAWHGRGVAQALMRTCLNEALARAGDVVWLQAWQQAHRALAFERDSRSSATRTSTSATGWTTITFWQLLSEPVNNPTDGLLSTVPHGRARR